MENLNTALLLMVVGMATVFAILLIVINLGKALIALVNKYAPEEVTPAKAAESIILSTAMFKRPACCVITAAIAAKTNGVETRMAEKRKVATSVMPAFPPC